MWIGDGDTGWGNNLRYFCKIPRKSNFLIFIPHTEGIYWDVLLLSTAKSRNGESL